MATQPCNPLVHSKRPDLVHPFGSAAEAGDVYFTEEEIVGWTGTEAQIGGANSSGNWFLTKTAALRSHILEKSLIRFEQRSPEV